MEDMMERSCGCPEDYHLADCPITAPAYDPSPADYEDYLADLEDW